MTLPYVRFRTWRTLVFFRLRTWRTLLNVRFRTWRTLVFFSLRTWRTLVFIRFLIYGDLKILFYFVSANLNFQIVTDLSYYLVCTPHQAGTDCFNFTFALASWTIFIYFYNNFVLDFVDWYLWLGYLLFLTYFFLLPEDSCSFP